MFKSFGATLAVVACALISPAQAGGSPVSSPGDAAVITQWNGLAENAIPTSAGVILPRAYALMHIAMFDAINSIEGGYKPYYTRVPATRYASSEAAAAQAAH